MVIGTSTVGSLSLGSIVGVESMLSCSSAEVGLGRNVVGRLGSEITIIFGSVGTAGLERPEDRKSASRIKKKQGCRH